MDITAEDFWEKLPDVLAIIAGADYVALDLEMTGVRVRDSLSTGEISVEQAYRRIRTAASTFSAIELGVTAIRWVESTYETHTFTIPISTLGPRNTKEGNQMSEFLDRKLTLSSNSLHFLRRHDFDVEKAMTVGVPYLSREERRLVSEQLWQDRDCKRLNLASLNAFNASFCEGLRTEVRRWLSTDPAMEAIFEIPEPRGTNLNKSTVKLVSQIVADEFPQCRCWRPARSSVMNITLRNVDRDDETQARTAQARKVASAKQFGLSCIIEALIGIRDHSKYKEMARIVNTMLVDSYKPEQSNREPIRWQGGGQQHGHDLLQKLQTSRPVLIGHNVVYDLAFIHSMFIGALPESLGEFRARIHDLFPRILDTKLLLSQTVDPDVVDPSLQDLYLELQVQAYPFVKTAAPGWGFTRYSSGIGANKGSAHNAGFDSYMTAVTFLKVCCKRMRLWKRATVASNNDGPASPSQQDVHTANSWYSLVDDQMSAMDKFLEGDDVRLPSLESDFFAPVRNKLRMSAAGILSLEAEQGEDPAPAEQQKHPDDGRCEENADAATSLRELYDEMQGLVGDMELLRMDASSSGSGVLCDKLGETQRRMEQTRDKARSFLAAVKES